MKNNKQIVYEIYDEQDHIVDEKGNNMICLRKIAFGEDASEDKAKYDIRKWIVDSEGNEIVGKGVSFLTPHGPGILASKLIEIGFGDTKEILELLKNREDFQSSLNMVMGKDSEFYDKNVDDKFFTLEEGEYQIIEEGE